MRHPPRGHARIPTHAHTRPRARDGSARADRRACPCRGLAAPGWRAGRAPSARGGRRPGRRRQVGRRRRGLLRGGAGLHRHPHRPRPCRHRRALHLRRDLGEGRRHRPERRGREHPGGRRHRAPGLVHHLRRRPAHPRAAGRGHAARAGHRLRAGAVPGRRRAGRHRRLGRDRPAGRALDQPPDGGGVLGHRHRLHQRPRLQRLGEPRRRAGRRRRQRQLLFRRLRRAAVPAHRRRRVPGRRHLARLRRCVGAVRRGRHLRAAGRGAGLDRGGERPVHPARHLQRAPGGDRRRDKPRGQVGRLGRTRSSRSATRTPPTPTPTRSGPPRPTARRLSTGTAW